MALFSTIIAFWFGSRVMEKREKFLRETEQPTRMIIAKKK